MPTRKRQRVRYAVVGLGWIAQSAVLPAFAHARRNSELAALVSGTPRKLEELGERYGARALYSYDEYDRMLQGGEVDAVYIALPNDLHHAFATRAAEAGVHVLCEKPLAVTEDECEEMIQAARRNRVLLMTAYRLHFERTNLDAIETVRSGALGDPRLFQSVFTMQVKPGNIRLAPDDAGGGPVYDIGIYCINAARCLFRAEPTEVLGMAATGDDPRFAFCHETVAATLRFPGQRLASFTCGFGSSSAATYRMVGTRGDLRVEHSYDIGESMTEHVTVSGRTRTRKFAGRDQFAPELLYFSDCVLEGEEPEPSGREGLLDVRVIRAILRSIDEGRPVRLAPTDRRHRPSLAQEIHRRPVDKQELVAADPASA